MKLRAPTLSSLPNTLLVSPTSSPQTRRSLIRLLSRLSSQSLVSLALSWLDSSNIPSCGQPYLANDHAIRESDLDEDYAFEPANDIEELRKVWADMLETGQQKKKREIVDRILEGDWRRGLSLKQIAMADCKIIEERANGNMGMRWTALRVVEQRFGKTVAAEEQEADEQDSGHSKKRNKSLFPSVRAGTFLTALQREIAPLVKAHFYVHRLENPNASPNGNTSGGLTIIRLFVSDTPYATNVSTFAQRSFTDSSRTVFIAFPDLGSSPFIYISVSGTSASKPTSQPSSSSSTSSTTTNTTTTNHKTNQPTSDITSLKRIILSAIPKALSRPQYRAALESTNLTTRSLATLCALRGSGRGVAANGAFGIFAAADGVEGTPLDIMTSNKGGQAKRRRSSSREVLGVLNGNTRPEAEGEDTEVDEDSKAKQTARKRRKIEARIRFGITGEENDNLPSSRNTSAPPPSTTSSTTIPRRSGGPYDGNAPLDRVHITLDEHLSHPSPPNQSTERQRQSGEATTTRAPITLLLQGSHVFSGMRKLMELGLLDPRRTPSWMTGEEAVTSAVVRDGKVVGGKGRGGGF